MQVLAICLDAVLDFIMFYGCKYFLQLCVADMMLVRSSGPSSLYSNGGGLFQIPSPNPAKDATVLHQLHGEPVAHSYPLIVLSTPPPLTDSDGQ